MNFGFGGGVSQGIEKHNYAQTDNAPLVLGSGGIHQGNIGTNGVEMIHSGASKGTDYSQYAIANIKFNPIPANLGSLFKGSGGL